MAIAGLSSIIRRRQDKQNLITSSESALTYTALAESPDVKHPTKW